MPNIQHMLPPILSVVHDSPHKIHAFEYILLCSLVQDLLLMPVRHNGVSEWLCPPTYLLFRLQLFRIANKGDNCLATFATNTTLLQFQSLHRGLLILYLHHGLWFHYPHVLMLQRQTALLVLTPCKDIALVGKRIAHAVHCQDLHHCVKALYSHRLVSCLQVVHTQLPVVILAPGVHFALVREGEDVVLSILYVYHLVLAGLELRGKFDLLWLRAALGICAQS
mmetsp:Transcript_30604/g.55904  ORF Transcript_30604/g.55904 Transcript_30604/m.55904 type:complete len:223 (-) Transcript_30604:99-767(-)